MDEPSFVFTYSDEVSVTATRDNSCIYRFFGELSVYDHIFVILNKDENSGLYVFRHQRGFAEALKFMTKNSYPTYLNLRSVPDCDMNAFNTTIHKDAADVEDGVPSDWS